MTPFALYKTLAYLLMPVGLVWLGLLLGALLCWRRGQRGLAGAALALALLHGCLGNGFLGSTLIASLEQRVPPVELETAGPFDAVFVLGGGSEQDPAGRPELGWSGDRLATAARLWHLGRARLLVTSGMGRDGVNGFRDGGEETKALWLALGVPEHAILVVREPCWVTRDEIAAYRRLQERFGWQRMALVSSAFHLPRALGLAARAGLPVTGVGADWRGRRRAFQLQQLVPQAEGLYCTQLACWEYLGRWAGR
jgi:uncharacterized SAM-binding protein YcdF (DUF218 family)